MTNFSMSRAAIPSVSSGSASVSKGIVGAFRSRGRIPCPNAGPGRSCRRRTLRFRSVIPSRDEAWALFREWTESDSLRKHVLGVEAAMRAYAREYGEDEELWAIAGIVHDLDYQRYPDLETGHPRMALEELRRRGYPDEVIDAVAGHATFLGVPRATRMAKTLFAVDELSGFIAACALVRPTGIHGLTPKSVKKKLKTPAFAAGGNRDEGRQGAAELGVDFGEHVARGIARMGGRAGGLGLGGGAGGGRPRRRRARAGRRLRRARCARDRRDGGARRRAGARGTRGGGRTALTARSGERGDDHGHGDPGCVEGVGAEERRPHTRAPAHRQRERE